MESLETTVPTFFRVLEPASDEYSWCGLVSAV
jgi:hypothetical protein